MATTTAAQRLAVLEKLKSVDDATRKEREEQLSLRRRMTKAREAARARQRRARVARRRRSSSIDRNSLRECESFVTGRWELDREWRCAQIAARRLELERAQKNLDEVDAARRAAALKLEVLSAPVDQGVTRAFRSQAREAMEEARGAARATALRDSAGRRADLETERAALEGEREALALKRRELETLAKMSKARLVEAELKAPRDAGDASGGRDEAATRDALERLVLGNESLATLPRLDSQRDGGDAIEQAMFAEVVEGDFTPRDDEADPSPRAAEKDKGETKESDGRFDAGGRPATPDGEALLRDAEAWLRGSTEATIADLRADVEASAEERAWAAEGPWAPLSKDRLAAIGAVDVAEVEALKFRAAATGDDLDRREAYARVFDAGQRGEWVPRRAGKGCENPNFKGSYLGRFPLVLADFWTRDHLSERSRP